MEFSNPYKSPDDREDDLFLDGPDEEPVTVEADQDPGFGDPADPPPPPPRRPEGLAVPVAAPEVAPVAVPEVTSSS